MKNFRFVTAVLFMILLSGYLVLWQGGGRAAVSARDDTTGGPPNITSSLVTGGFSRPVDIANAGDNRLFIVEQAGVIEIIDPDGSVRPDPFLNITDRVETMSEQGLLGLTFDPDYVNNGYFYVNYTYCTESSCPDFGDTPNLYTRISRFSVTADPNVADPASELIIMEVQQPFGNHNAGDINFGPDGYLYIGLGDGGSGGDPQNNGQSDDALLGKMLRVDVHGGGSAPECDSDGNYTIPNDNPFVDGAGGACDEIWALGLRNPWRFSFDSQTGDMYIGDVGQNAWEEVNFQPANGGGENWGWKILEGTHCYPSGPCNTTGLEMPFFDYPHNASGGFAVSGGYVYRGNDYSDLTGYYLFADYATGNFWTAFPNGGGFDVTPINQLPDISSPSTFGESCDNELYVADYGDGQIYQIQTQVVAQHNFEGGSTLYLPLIMGSGTPQIGQCVD